jgi:hypothetical protein
MREYFTLLLNKTLESKQSVQLDDLIEQLPHELSHFVTHF